MSWLFSQALVEEYSEGIYSDGEPSVQLNVMPTPQGFWRNDKMIDASRLSQFGQTLQLLTESHGEAVLTSFLEGFPVRIYQSQDQGPGYQALEVDSGLSSSESLVKYDHDSSMWKTRQLSLLEGSDEFLETWPKWGSMLSGECWERMTLARHTEESGSGLWPVMIPTPSATEGGPMPELAHEPRMNQRNYSKKTGNHCQVTLRRWVELWPTPTVCGNYNRKGASKTSGDGLATAVKNWPTPVASMSKGSSPASLTRKTGADRSNDRLDHAVMASDGGQLNPAWVEWLMGWPIGWTDLKPLGMDKFQEWQQQHSIY